MLNEDNLISTLEQSLRQFQAAEQRLQERLRKIEDEAKDLKIEIEALQNSAEKTEEALESLFSTMRSGARSWKTHKKTNYDGGENDYQKNQPPRYDENDYPKKSRYEDDDGYEVSRRYNPRQNNGNQPPPQQQDNYRNNSVAYLNHQPPPRSVPSIAPQIEPLNHRFAERTITQACTLLLRESNSPLHVNELYNLLIEGGFKFTGNNPTISIAVSLNRNRRFRKVAPGTFDLIMRNASQAAS